MKKIANDFFIYVDMRVTGSTKEVT